MSRLSFRRRLSVLLGSAALMSPMFLALDAALAPLSASVQALSADIVISQVYGGGGNIGAPYQSDFVELFNRGTTSASLNGMSIQYASATGAGALGANTGQLTELPNVSLAPGQYFLVQQAAGTGTAPPLPTPDLVDATPIAMSATGGKVALVASAVGLGCNGSSLPCDATQLALIKDLVGYGSANFFEGVAPTPAPGNTTSVARLAAGCTETDSNASDFATGAPNPRNSASVPNACSPADAPPQVTTTVPVDGATDFPFAANLSVSFSEPVNVADPWFSLDCSVTPSPVAATYSGGPTTFSIDPAEALTHGETCTLTVLAAAVADQDSNDPPQNMVTDFTVGFTPFNVCDSAFTPIYSVQGSGLSAAITGNVTIEGVVTGDFEGTSAASGFYLQDPIGDGDPATSDGIFVFTGSSSLVSVGQAVRVTGFARERFNQTAINGSNSNNAAVPAANIVQCGTGSVEPADVTLPVTSPADFERHEGMSVRFPQDLVIAEYFNYDRFGELVLALPLAGESRPFTPTAVEEPGAAAIARAAANALSRITLDDVQSAQNPPVLRHPNGMPFALDNRFRGGDLVTNAVGVMGFDFSLYRVFPTGPADYTAINPRPASPDEVGGTVHVAAMNTLNFFVTPDYPSGSPLDNKCGPLNNVECRGWDSDQADEFTRQLDKLLQALIGLDADVIGLNELENSTGVEPLQSITEGMPGYDYVDTGTIGTDAIKVGLIYRPDVVTPVGGFETLDSLDDPRFIDTKSRPALAQTFEVNDTGARFTVVVNHLKSKGSDCNDVGDPDLGDGQGNCSQTRRAAAEALVDWLATDPTGSGDADFLIMGDLNSYAMEDAIDEIKAGADDSVGTGDDYTNLIAQFQGTYAYSYTFDGQAGYLDHALASASVLDQVTGATEWHINSDEPDVLDYDTSFKPPAQDALFELNQFRTSDHDPVIVGLTPNAPPVVSANFSGASIECGPDNGTLSIEFSDPDADDVHRIHIDWGDGTTATIDPAVSPLNVPHTYGSAGPYVATVTVTDDHGHTDQVAVAVTVDFATSGVLQPINASGSSVFRHGSTIPVKVAFSDCDGSIPTDLAPTITVTMLSGSDPGWTINEPVSTSAADTGGIMRFSDGKWIYNLATKPLPDPTATYRITIGVAETGQTVTADFGLRR